MLQSVARCLSLVLSLLFCVLFPPPLLSLCGNVVDLYHFKVMKVGQVHCHPEQITHRYLSSWIRVGCELTTVYSERLAIRCLWSWCELPNPFSVCHLLWLITRCYMSCMSTLLLTIVRTIFSNLHYVKNTRDIPTLSVYHHNVSCLASPQPLPNRIL
jgi:hypothetical protein